MTTSYTYGISSFPNSKADVGRLAEEVRASVIITSLAHIDQSGTDTIVVFNAALSVGDKGLLDTIVGQHSGEPLKDPAPPTTSDGKPIVQPSMFPGGVYLYITGSGDGTARGNGQPFAVQSDVAGDSSIEFSFMDWVYLSAGGMAWMGAEFGDTVTFDFYAPASPVAPNGAHTGNCNLVPPFTGAPAILIAPANGNGAYDVDLANAVPVPAYGPTGEPVGFWDWSEPNTGRGSIQPSQPMKGGYYLFAVQMPLVKFANRLPLLGTGAMDMQPPPIKSKKMLPHWKGRVTLHNAGHSGLKAAWWLATARAQTT